MNNILFGTIGILMLAIATLGVAELRVQAHTAARAEAGPTTEQPGVDGTTAIDVTEQPAATTVVGNVVQAGEKVKAAATGNWNEGREIDSDNEGDDEGERVVAPTPTPVQPTPITTPKPTTPTPTTTQAPGTYTMAQIATHSSATSCYSAISGSVYDLTAWISQHPGGSSAILSICGRDGTAAFTAQHGGARRPANELAGLKIGVVVN